MAGPQVRPASASASQYAVRRPAPPRAPLGLCTATRATWAVRPASACPSSHRSRTVATAAHITGGARPGSAHHPRPPTIAAAKPNSGSPICALALREGVGQRVYRLNGHQLYTEHQDPRRSLVEQHLLCRELQAAEERVAGGCGVKASTAYADELDHWRGVAREEAARRFEALSELSACRRALDAASSELVALRGKDALKEDRRRARPATAATVRRRGVGPVAGWPSTGLLSRDSFAEVDHCGQS